MVLETARLKLVPWTLDDVADFRQLATDPLVLRYINGGIPYKEDRILEFVTRQERNEREHGFSMWRLVLRPWGDFAGFCGIQPVPTTGEIEIGWWLRPKFWRQGLATEAARAALQVAFRERKIPEVIAVAMPDNAASRRIMLRLGMTYTGPSVYRDLEVVRYVVKREEYLAHSA
jgi:ribosomal-protein-alanine N-acetyltransferase